VHRSTSPSRLNGSGWLGLIECRYRGFSHRETKHEAAASSGLALDGDRATEDGGDPLNDGETKANAGESPAACVSRSEERLEDMEPVIGCQTPSAVLHGERYDIFFATNAHANWCSGRAVLARVVEEVVEQLSEQVRVNPHK
jgi:hypothetical protein